MRTQAHNYGFNRVLTTVTTVLLLFVLSLSLVAVVCPSLHRAIHHAADSTLEQPHGAASAASEPSHSSKQHPHHGECLILWLALGLLDTCPTETILSTSLQLQWVEMDTPSLYESFTLGLPHGRAPPLVHSIA